MTRLTSRLACVVVLLLVPSTGLAQTAQEAGFEDAAWTVLPVDASLAATLTTVTSRAADLWVAYAVPAVRDAGMCCHHDRDDDRACRVCELDGRGTFGGGDPGHEHRVARVELNAEPTARVLLRFVDGELERVRVFSADCTLDAGGGRVVWLDGVAPAESLIWLAGLAEGGPSRREVADGAVAAVAAHSGSDAVARLEDWSTARHPRKLRERAIFWMGTQRATETWSTLQRLVTDDPDANVRDRAIFAVHVAQDVDAVPVLIRAARYDESNKVRRSAMLWLGHRAGERAVAALKNAVDDPNVEIKKHAVFAISQLPGDEGVSLLLEIARTHSQPEVRKQALFWLGQSGDPRALDLIEDLLTGV